MTAPTLDVGALGPMIAVAIGAALLPLIEVWLARQQSFLSRPLTRAWRGSALSLMATLVLLAALLLTVNGFGDGPRTFNPAHPMVRMDAFAHFLNGVVLVSALLTVLASSKFLADLEINYGEYYTLLLAAVLGMLFLTAATDLMMLFLAVEMMSIPIYVLAGFRRGSLRSNESALKYFLIGSVASGVLVYGCALLYGATGTLSLEGIRERFDPENGMAIVGAGLLLVGLAFKISSVPFHQWAPDVYEGAPTTVTGFMATAVKVAAFGALLRVLVLALEPGSDLIYGALWVLAALSMTVGNVMAIVQQNTKRMLAYSSIAHAGYVLVGVVAGTRSGHAAVLFYLFAYTFMTIGAFTVVAVLARRGEERERIDDLAGLGASSPLLAAVMALCMFSLAGIPGTAGFMGKYNLFLAAIERANAVGDSSLVWLAIIAVLNSAVSLAYYLRVPVVMYMRDAAAGDAPDQPGSFEALVLVTCVAAVLLAGIVPYDLFVFGDASLLDWALVASASLMP
jgi:NADH-quinone oxidoreductase subunit N